MALPELSLLGIFLTGLLGGVHCAGMCGGIVSALGMVNRQPVARQINIPVMVVGVATAPNSSVVRHALSASATVAYYNLGRVSTYTVLGALAGGVGSTAWLIESVLPVQQGAYFISNLLLILMGLYVIGFKRIGVMV
jgi:sulfite exporter TauE/SafE